MTILLRIKNVKKFKTDCYNILSGKGISRNGDTWNIKRDNRSNGNQSNSKNYRKENTVNGNGKLQHQIQQPIDTKEKRKKL
ncbi:hypothetical protein PIROE2DRAFT_13793 [Piromyces sp. E2]|nr:hypothetical protein PIROE2DRAFT_13793 [Piromyces sp. E2]|eukprot:OUM60444.1 hypothetical protein PIROE2DRAFT_13793 [Piromyces sp. E2]